MIINNFMFGTRKSGKNSLYSFTSHEFTNLSTEGRSGPTSVAAYNGTEIESFISVSAGRQVWTVPQSGNYEITMAGAQGGVGGGTAATTYYGGGGGAISAVLELEIETILYLLVGQRGGYACITGSGGGGGASIIATSPNSGILMVAGGGSAGGGNSNPRHGIDALVWNGSNSGTGNGGVSGSGGGSGGGISSSATGTTADSPDLNGIGYQSTMLGGHGGSCAASRATCAAYTDADLSTDFGGFGGGGGGEWCSRGAIGAGGGYTGGNGNTSSDSSTGLTASTSYIDSSATSAQSLSTNKSLTLASGSSLHGYITITLLNV